MPATRDEVGTQHCIWNSQLLVTNGRCVFCDSKGARKMARRSDSLSVWECQECHLAFVDPRPNAQQLDDYYDSDYFSGRRDFFAGQDYCEVRDQAIARKSVTGYAEIISNIDVHQKSILEIGCGSGALLQLLKEHGPSRLTGIDRAEHPIAYGRSRYSLDLRSATLETAQFPGNSFDLIIMIDLIEHIENLPTFLREIERVLRPGGFLFLLTPNYSAFLRARSLWTCLHKDFEHLQYFSSSSLEVIAGRFHWKLVRWWTRGLPVPLAAYPRLSSRGLHRFFYPQISVTNLARKAWYTPWPFMGKNFGHELLAIVKKQGQ